MAARRKVKQLRNVMQTCAAVQYDTGTLPVITYSQSNTTMRDLLSTVNIGQRNMTASYSGGTARVTATKGPSYIPIVRILGGRLVCCFVVPVACGCLPV